MTKNRTLIKKSILITAVATVLSAVSFAAVVIALQTGTTNILSDIKIGPIIGPLKCISKQQTKGEGGKKVELPT